MEQYLLGLAAVILQVGGGIMALASLGLLDIARRLRSSGRGRHDEALEQALMASKLAFPALLLSTVGSYLAVRMYVQHAPLLGLVALSVIFVLGGSIQAIAGWQKSRDNDVVAATSKYFMAAALWAVSAMAWLPCVAYYAWRASPPA
ncbi:MAG: hypothetical protein COT81_00535 [Candidatus Buchananbacteria bacterium CG10_big_fil_rev_8_21_14_0_10_42_9]|uniref:Uncharacterized protein n=1 Tax=Candidatus Buchananbacteria bacterium CG10_big_fil_rev_8_21_14_0_10_42_9 TaxID=1974526 RepID=A0A2H0W2B0_9BACT|nr:MAG: hypothetical protein COT81_00535 [Candidatus Buchananbacteria bacterium CG10_big_fil_rev_8_21_14_0_10_42_9]